MNPDIIRINCIYLFATLLDDKSFEINDFFKLLDEFIKKIISKKNFDEKVIKNKIYDIEIQKLMDDNKLNKIGLICENDKIDFCDGSLELNETKQIGSRVFISGSVNDYKSNCEKCDRCCCWCCVCIFCCTCKDLDEDEIAFTTCSSNWKYICVG